MKPREEHGMSNTPEYLIWRSMISRCTNSNVSCYHRYGGRGITVCERWRNSFEAFYADVGPRPSPEYSLDRKENDQGYEPGNVFWRTSTEQNNNRSDNRHFEYNGKTVNINQIAELAGLNRDVVKHRLAKGDSVERAMRPLEGAEQRQKRYEYNGKQLTLKELAVETGMDYKLLRGRIVNNKMPVTKAVSTVEKTNARFLVLNGERRTLSEWGRITGLGESIIRGRIDECGWSIERALTEPLQTEKRNIKYK